MHQYPGGCARQLLASLIQITRCVSIKHSKHGSRHVALQKLQHNLVGAHHLRIVQQSHKTHKTRLGGGPVNEEDTVSTRKITFTLRAAFPGARAAAETTKLTKDLG